MSNSVAPSFQEAPRPFGPFGSLGSRRISDCPTSKTLFIVFIILGAVALMSTAAGCLGAYHLNPTAALAQMTISGAGGSLLILGGIIGIVTKHLKHKNGNPNVPPPYIPHIQPLTEDPPSQPVSLEELKKLLALLKAKHTSRLQKLTLTIDGRTYNAWYMKETRYVNIQAADDWQRGNQNKLAVRLDDAGSIHSVYVDGTKVECIPEDKKSWVLATIEACERTGQSDSEKPAEAQLSASDLKIFKAVLQLAYPQTFFIKNRYMVWYTPAKKSISIQKLEDYDVNHSKQNNKLEITLDDFGRITSLWINGAESKNRTQIPEEFLTSFKKCFKAVLKLVAIYQLDWRPEATILIKIVRQGLKKIPLFHLKQFYKNAKQSAACGKPDPQLKVGFLKDDLTYATGVDAGGLSRDYFDDLCEAITKSPKLKFQKIDTSSLVIPRTHRGYVAGQTLPNLDDKSIASYAHLGGLFMYCYLSQAQHSHWDLSCMTGLHFDDALFKAMLCLTAEEITLSFYDLSLKTQLKMCHALATAHDEPIYKRWVELLQKDRLSDKELQEAAESACYGGCLPEDLITKEGNPDSALIQKNPAKVKQALKDILFGSTGAKGQFGAQLAPIHAMAQGMLSLCASEQQELAWNNLFLNMDFREFSKKVQGSIDRQEISNSFVLNPGLSGAQKKEIEKKTTWLKEWLLHEASDDDIRHFLKFVTGSSCLLKGKKITVINQLGDFFPVPKVHTCSLQIELSPVPAGDPRGYNDFTKENFIACIKELALTDPGTYSAQ
jgi:hypothetical protein